jgi:hypothetical protein
MDAFAFEDGRAVVQRVREKCIDAARDGTIFRRARRTQRDRPYSRTLLVFSILSMINS